MNNSELERFSQEEIDSIRQSYGISQGEFVLALHSRIDAVKNQLGVAQAVKLLQPALRENLIVLCSGEIGWGVL